MFYRRKDVLTVSQVHCKKSNQRLVINKRVGQSRFCGDIAKGRLRDIYYIYHLKKKLVFQIFSELELAED